MFDLPTKRSVNTLNKLAVIQQYLEFLSLDSDWITRLMESRAATRWTASVVTKKIETELL